MYYLLQGRVTPLHLGVLNNYRQICAILIECGAHVDAVDMQGCTPLHYVQSTTLVKLLIQHNANPLAKNKSNQTPRMYYLAHTPIEKQDGALLKKLELLEDELMRKLFSEDLHLVQTANALKYGSENAIAVASVK